MKSYARLSRQHQQNNWLFNIKEGLKIVKKLLGIVTWLVVLGMAMLEVALL